MKKTSNHIVNYSWTRHLLLCLVSLNILVASTGFTSNIFDYPDTPQTELLVLDSDQDKSFDLRQAHQLSLLPIPVIHSFIKNYQLVVHNIQYARHWNQVKKEGLHFDIPVFFFHALFYSNENPPLPTFIS